MSKEIVQLIIGRAVTDPEFRELFFKDLDEAIPLPSTNTHFNLMLIRVK